MRIGFFGFGNMGRAIANAIRYENASVTVFTYTPSGKTKIEEMPKDLDYYFLAFKPQSLNDFQYDFLPQNKVISILAGVSLEKLNAKFSHQKIIRLMPNTPSLYQAGAGLVYLPDAFSIEEKDALKKLLEATGKIFVMNSEDQLDRTTGFSGSGPGLIFELARIFEEELIQLTNDKTMAKDIIAQTFLGSALLMSKEPSTSFMQLRENVTSKKGVTYAALQVLEENKLQTIFKDAFAAAYKRTLDFK